MKGKNILITGGTTGIGLATAQLLVSEGAKVIVTGRNPKTLAEAEQALPPGAIILKSDAASVEEASALGDEVKQHVEKLDGAFLNAGVGNFKPIEAVTPDDFEWMFGINVRGLYFQLQSLLPLLASPSSVVFNASAAAHIALTNSSVYSATKAAVVSLGKTLGAELGPRGIRVNTLSPGPVRTPIIGKIGLDAEAQKGMEEHLAQMTVVKRFGEASEVAKLARFLLSEDSAFILGTDVLVDGGVALVN